MAFGFSFGFPSARTFNGAYVPFSPELLFEQNEQGAWYDPSDFTTMFQDAAGTNPVTAVEQSVGSILDKRSSAYSVYLDGSGDYLYTPMSTALEFGTGDFTVEGWFYTANQNAALRPLFSVGSYNSGILLRRQSGSDKLYINNTSYDFSLTYLPLSQWVHVALTRASGNVNLWLNGTSRLNFTNTSNITPTTQVTIGASTHDFNEVYAGYISNFRIVKGTAVYTSTFTPPTAPLTAISGTSLLTCGNSWASNPAISSNGDARVYGLNPFDANIGNHAAQSTSGSRPILRQEVGGAYYLAFDGTNDNLFTSSVDFSATDKMTVFAGVRKLSDAAQGCVAELSSTIASNNGAFLLAAPDGATDTFAWDSKGTLQVDAVATGIAAPATRVLTGISDIGGDVCTLRVNGVQADTDTADQGTGNYGNYPIYIGARNKTSLQLNGRIYSLIIRGASTTQTLVSQTENWVAAKSGVTL